MPTISPTRDHQSRLYDVYLGTVTVRAILTINSTYNAASAASAAFTQEIAAQYTRPTVTYGADSFNTGTSRNERQASFAVTAGADAIQYDGVALMVGADAISSYSVTSADNTTQRLTFGSAHGRTDGDKIIITADSTGTLPAGMPTGILYAKVISSTVIETYTNSGLTTLTTWSTNGTLPFRMRNANGDMDYYGNESGVITIATGATRTFTVNLNTAGNGISVN